MVFPTAVNFLTTFGSETMIAVKPTVSEVFSFYSRVILGTGFVFQIPTVVFLLARIGLVTPGFLWRNFKYAVLTIFITAAIVTPPDVVTQMLLAFPDDCALRGSRLASRGCSDATASTPTASCSQSNLKSES